MSNYVAIARKWRPNTFEDIAGQTHVTRTLQNAIKLDRVHHAFLFAGPRGVGKTTAARALARSLNCEQGPTPTPCGVCPACVEILAGNSPDVIEIDGASNNSVEDIRELRESVRYLPQRGRKKVYIIDEVHMLSKGAFNALLKTLEEPPGHVIFLFATTEPQKIPDTILSRVQRFEFKRIPMSVVVDRLRRICDAEGVKIPDAALRLVARAGEGSMRDAQSLLDQVISFSAGINPGGEISTAQVAETLGLVDRGLLYAMLEGMLKGDADRCLEAIESVYNTGYDLSEFTGEMLELLRNATLVGLSPTSKRFLDVPDEERAQLSELAKDTPTDVLVRSFQVMLDVHDQVARAPRPRLVLEMSVARLVSIRPARPVDQLLDRLADLERRLRQGGAPSQPRGGGARPGGPGRDEDPHPRGGGGPRSDGNYSGGGPSNRPPTASLDARGGGAPALALVPDVEEYEYEDDAPIPALSALAEPEEGEGGGDYSDIPLEETASTSWIEEGEEEGAAEGAPPPLIADATPADRFQALRRWLKAGGVTYDVWADQSALSRVAPPIVRVAFPSPFTTSQARQRQDDPRLRAGIMAYFPGCDRAEAVQRPGKDGFETWEELQAAAREERRRRLRADLEQDPLIQEIVQLMDAKLDKITLPDDPPER